MRSAPLKAMVRGHGPRRRPGSLAFAPPSAADPIKIGLVTALSGQSAQAGEAITRGLAIAIDEINAKGGVLGGRKIELVRRDDEANPRQGPDRRARAAVQGKGGGAVRRSRHPRVAGHGADRQREKVPFMGPWAAGRSPATAPTPTSCSGYRPSTSSSTKAMLQYAQKNFNTKTPGIIVVNNPWGESNRTD